MCYSSFTGASNSRIDGMSVISVTYSTCLAVMFGIQEPPIFNNYTKAITHGQSAIFARFLSTGICVILHSQEHPIQGLMV